MKKFLLKIFKICKPKPEVKKIVKPASRKTAHNPDNYRYMSFLDAGLSPEQLKDHIRQMYKNKPAVLSESFYFILFKKIK